MEIEDIHNELPEELTESKPKRKKRTSTTQPEIDSASKPAQTKKKRARKSTGKKKTSTTKRKKVVDDHIITHSIPEEDLNSQSITVLKPGSKLQLPGQAEVSKVRVEVLADRFEKKESPVVQDAQSIEPTEKNNPSPLNVANHTLSGNTLVETTQSTTLPFAAIKVRNVVAKVVDLVAEIIPNKVIVQGIIHEQLFFVGTDGIVHHLADDIHFSTFLDIPGVQPGMNAQVTAIIEEIITELAPDGQSILKKIILEVFVKVTETVQLNLEPGNGPALLLKKVVGENSAQTLVETDLTLFTPAIKIDEIVGKIRDLEVQIIPDKVIIQGILHKQIFFIDTANRGRHQAEDIPFSLFIDIPGAVPGMDFQVHPRIEAIFFQLISSTVVRQKAILEFFVKVTENVIQQVAVGAGPLLKVEEFIGENTVQELSETIVTLTTPAIKVREIIAQVRNLVSHVIQNKVIVQGIIHKQIFFISTDNIERHQAEDVPFSLFLDIPGIDPGDNVHLSTKIEAVFFELISSNQLRQKVIVAVTAIITREIQLNLVLGVGSLYKVEQVVGENTKQVLVVRREEIVGPVVPVKPVVTKVTVVSPGQQVIATQQILLQNKIKLPVKAIKVKEITATISDVTVQVIPDGVLVEGFVNKTVIFVDADNIVRSVNERIPFSILVQIPGITPDQISNVEVNIEDIIFNLDQTCKAVNQTIVLQAVVEGEQEPTPSFTVVTDVSGPGIVQTKVRVQGLILTPSGAVFQEFDVVTDVSGPGIISVTRETVLLQRVGEPAPTPITVVTDVVVDP